MVFSDVGKVPVLLHILASTGAFRQFDMKDKRRVNACKEEKIFL